MARREVLMDESVTLKGKKLTLKNLRNILMDKADEAFNAIITETNGSRRWTLLSAVTALNGRIVDMDKRDEAIISLEGIESIRVSRKPIVD